MKNINDPRSLRAGTRLVILGMAALLISSLPAAANPIEQGQSLQSILERLAHYQHNQDHDTVLEFQAHIRTHKQTPDGRAQCESLLLVFLQGEATEDGKWEVCRQLRSLGTDASVPVLAKMLIMDGASAEMARYALEKIPGTAADRALLSALQSSSGKNRLGLVSTLGHRGQRGAVSVLAGIAAEPDEEAAEAAVTALGRIGTIDAANSLVRFLGSKNEGLRISAASSLLNCADGFLASGEADRAFPFYRQLLGSDISLSVSRAALKGLISASDDHDKERSLILEVLQNPDPGMHSAVIGMVPRVFAAPEILPLCELLPRLPEQSQVQLLSVLSGYDNDVVLVTAAQALSSHSLEIRLAALRALGRQGNPSSAKLLVRHAGQSRGVEQAAARTALWNLKGSAVDATILEALSRENDPALQGELIRSLGERRISEGKALLFEKLRDPDLRLEAIRALGHVSEPRDLPLLIDRLLECENEAEQNELANTLAATARKISRPHARASLVTKRLNGSQAPEDHRVLLLVLGKIGDDSSLGVLRRSLEDQDSEVREAAARALIEWPTATARDDVFLIAETSSHPTLQVLAVRAYVRMVGMERFRRPEAAVASLEAALPLVKRPEEMMSILGILPQFPCREALALAERFVADDSVGKEAEAAVARLRRSLR